MNSYTKNIETHNISRLVKRVNEIPCLEYSLKYSEPTRKMYRVRNSDYYCVFSFEYFEWHKSYHPWEVPVQIYWLWKRVASFPDGGIGLKENILRFETVLDNCPAEA